MGKYESYTTNKPKARKREIHAIWRGIGFILIILIPVLSYVGTLLLLEENAKRGWFFIPKDLISPYVEPYFFVKIILTVVIMFVFYSIFLFIAALINRIIAPPRYGVYDVPAQAFHGKKKSR
jgi:quinol-cytochrome oxidoreductase complex cytochrome b subunit